MYFFKKLVPGDKSAMNPYGIRLGTPALTTRGMREHDITVVAELIDKGIIHNPYNLNKNCVNVLN